jgi:hypothetical protein
VIFLGFADETPGKGSPSVLFPGARLRAAEAAEMKVAKKLWNSKRRP